VDAKGEVPTPRWGHSATAGLHSTNKDSLFTLHKVGKTIFVIGGEAVGGPLSELYIFDTGSSFNRSKHYSYIHREGNMVQTKR
jgi:hypothetical protein